MKLYDTTLPHRSLIHEIWDLCDADITSYPLKAVVRRVNSALETLVGLIINADGTWQFDDTNYTTTPVGKQDLTSAEISYSFADEYLEIEEIDILDTGGRYIKITPFDAVEMGVSFEEYFNITFAGSTYTAPVGFPFYYDKHGDTIRLSAGPTAANTTLTKGLRARFTRTAKLYTMSNSTTITSGEESVEPGIASPYHQLIAYMSSIPFCMSNNKRDRVPLYEKKVDEMTKDMIDFYTKREKDARKIMTPKRIQYL